jgi:hypothetical protein
MSPSALAFGAFLGMAACTARDVRTSDGQMVHMSSSGDWQPAIQASAMHDLACDRLTSFLQPGASLYSAEGCGHRVTYVFLCPRSGDCRAALIGMVPLEPGRPEPGGP